MDIFLLVLILWLVLNSLIIFVFRRDLIQLWQEPMLKYPVIIFESDDWGPGPESHQLALKKLVGILSKFKDDMQHHPVMTLAMILAVPDVKKMEKDLGQKYQRLSLSDQRFESLVKVINDGVSKQVFALQLHGMEHYWPEALIKALNNKEVIENWFISGIYPQTEKLPSELQSRWTDASQLPSLPLEKNDINTAVLAEVDEYKNIFGEYPNIVVPPTFVWNADVEKAWFKMGVKYLVTPGRQYDQRLPEDKLRAVGAPILNGQISDSGLVYVVRDEYFEPALGHDVIRGLSAIERKTALGRPTILETHRFNFLNKDAEKSFLVMEQFLREALASYPAVKFFSTEKLAHAFINKDNDIIETEFSRRLKFWLQRLKTVTFFWRIARVSGLFILVALAEATV